MLYKSVIKSFIKPLFQCDKSEIAMLRTLVFKVRERMALVVPGWESVLSRDSSPLLPGVVISARSQNCDAAE
jgi:hypothetical protein